MPQTSRIIFNDEKTQKIMQWTLGHIPEVKRVAFLMALDAKLLRETLTNETLLNIALSKITETERAPFLMGLDPKLLRKILTNKALHGTALRNPKTEKAGFLSKLASTAMTLIAQPSSAKSRVNPMLTALSILSAFGIGMGLGFTPVLGTTLGLTLLGTTSLGVIGAAALTGGILAGVVLLAVVITLIVTHGMIQPRKTAQWNHPSQRFGTAPNLQKVPPSYTPGQTVHNAAGNEMGAAQNGAAPRPSSKKTNPKNAWNIP